MKYSDKISGYRLLVGPKKFLEYPMSSLKKSLQTQTQT